jgi:hypothetical protein
MKLTQPYDIVNLVIMGKISFVGYVRGLIGTVGFGK